MARARLIRPGFFMDEVLAELPPLARLLFAGLWTIADRLGRLEDRPKRIKAETLPYDDCDVGEMLAALSEHGFITRYESGGHRYIQVVAFPKHQSPHVKEAASTIPAPGEHQASPVLAPDEHGASPPCPCSITDTDTDTDTDTSLRSVPTPRVPRVQAPSEEDLRGRAERALALAWYPSDLRQLGALLAEENKTKTVSLARLVREIYLPIVAMQDEFSREALRYGIRAAITGRAPNERYVRKAAAGYRTQGNHDSGARATASINGEGWLKDLAEAGLE